MNDKCKDKCKCSICEGTGKVKGEVECDCCQGTGNHYIEAKCGAYAEIPCEKCDWSGEAEEEVECENCDGTGIIHNYGEIESMTNLLGEKVEFKTCKKCGKRRWIDMDV